jgi:radical SAM family uncharacterized protein/radical SAM-linked protein
MNKPLLSLVESRFLPFVEKPLRYLGNELNVIRKNLESISLHGVLCFPEVYDIGMSHSGLQMLYHIVNSNEKWALSRCFTPWADAESILRKESIPLYCLEYMLPLGMADWIGFSIQYELQYTNIINMLDLGGVPVFSRDRRDGQPIVIAGGPCMNNPEPVADFIDAFAIGDGEETIVALCNILESCKKNGVSRTGTLKALSGIRGVYVPSLYPVEPAGLFVVPSKDLPVVVAAKVPELTNEIYPDRPLVPLVNVIHHRLAVEVMRGCTRSCRFCAAGYYYRPVRERATSDICDHINRAFASTGWREIGMLSLSTADYSCLPDLLGRVSSLMHEHRIDVSIPSTRIDALTQEQYSLLESITSTSSFTIAPEAGSSRLRKVINKNFTDVAVLDTVDLLLKGNVQTLKLYFMIGLPTETPEDIEALVEMSANIADRAWQKSRRKAVHVAISPFSPKAQTPFQWEAMESRESLLEKSKYIKHALSSKRNVKVSYHDPRLTYLETVMARGDRRLSAVIYRAWQDGARNDGWMEYFNPDLWSHAAIEVSVDMGIYVSSIPDDQRLPWACVSNGISADFLRSEREKAMAGIPEADCRSGKCNGCGLCDGEITMRKSSPEPVHNLNNLKQPAQMNSSDCKYSYRVRYEKKGFIRFLGHRDMMNVFHRAFSASLFPVAFTNGFHPNPRISFGPPLPLGVAGEAEWFDVVATRKISSEDIDGVNRFLPEGLAMIDFMDKSGKTESLNVCITHGKYVFCPLFDIERDQLEKIVVDTIGRSEIIVLEPAEENSSSVAKSKNIKPLISGIFLGEDNGNNAVVTVLSLMPGATCRPYEFINGLFPGRSTGDFYIARKSCLNGTFEML